MKNNKPLASLSLDLDNLWSYMKTHGDSGWESFPSYLDIVVPRVLDFLERRGLKITFFVVGQDAALQKNYATIRSIADAGHEIGNHSFNHEPWLHLYSEQQIEAELSKTEEHLERVTGQKTIGFRGPGYSLSLAVLRVLTRRGYYYDASTLPTFLGPLARAYYFMTTKLSPEEKENRKLLFGQLRDGLRSLHPYRWHIDGLSEKLLEIPVTTMPIFKIPFHISYILYLYRFSPILARTYFRLAMVLCKLTHTQPSLLLHPLDFLGGDDIKELSFFPAMNLPGEEKVKLVSDILSIYSDYYTIVPMSEHARALYNEKDMTAVEPKFRSVTIHPQL
ncbi:MAG: polysaccharide deacetylase family protein [Anaerolineales bacterium]|nr:polysaccharide deacetylase family protein [Anaerolineales bacterium]